MNIRKKIAIICGVLLFVLLSRFGMDMADWFSTTVAVIMLLYEIMRQVWEHEKEIDAAEEQRRQAEELAASIRRRESFLAMKRVSDRNHDLRW